MGAGQLAMRVAIGVAAAAALVGVALLGRAWWDNRIPATYGVMQFGVPDYGGGPRPNSIHMAQMPGMAGTRVRQQRVTQLVDATRGAPDVRFTLVAEHA